MDTIWWTRVPSARSLIESVAGNLLNEKTVLLQHNEPLPWKDTFSQIIREYVSEKNSSKSFAVIRDENDPGKYLLNEYCKKEKRAQYRPTKGYAAFLAESNDIVLNEYYFWVNIKDSQGLNTWCKFVSEYAKLRPKGKSKAVFLLDCQGISTKDRYKGIERINTDLFIGDYDKRIFSTLISGSINEGVLLKAYMTELLISVIGTDIELLAEIISKYKDFLADPLTAINNATQSTYRNDGNEFLFSKDRAEVNHDIWKAQIKAIYPLLEEYRQTFIEKYNKQIASNCLPVENSAGEVMNDAQGLELGTLVYLAGIGKLSLSTEEYERLVLFKDARNTLSHLGILEINQIEQLFAEI